MKHSAASQTTGAVHRVLVYSSWMVLASEGLVIRDPHYAVAYQYVTWKTLHIVWPEVEVERNNPVASSHVWESATAANLSDTVFDPADWTVTERNDPRNPLQSDDWAPLSRMQILNPGWTESLCDRAKREVEVTAGQAAV